MRIRRRQLRVLQIALLLLALANAAFAQGDVWRCDTGELCGSHAAGGCCCPPERRPATCDADASAGCCSTTNTDSSATSCCTSHTGDRTSESGAALSAAPHCRCLFTVSATSEAAPATATVAVTGPDLALPASDGVLIPLPSPVSFHCPGDDPLASPLIRLSPPGSRAPPV